MFALSNITAAQVSRARHLPQSLDSKSPLHDATLEAPRQRNALLDSLFYDVGRLSSQESANLAPRYAAEGALLAVGPSGAPSLHIWPDHDAFAAEATEEYRALVVAGVGSSALGAAAFARNVADAIEAPVLAVVSGYGLADLLTEALGGYFLFGQLNSLRHLFEALDDAARPTHTATGTGAGTGTGASSDPTALVRKSLDVRTLVDLLSGPREFDYLLGHSKGNLVISEALFELGEQNRTRLNGHGTRTHMVTLSARVAMPRAMQRVTDILGQLDGFGLMNSRLTIPTDVSVPFAWHHTNTELPFHLPVTQTLRRVLN